MTARRKDWASGIIGFVVAWGFPIGAMLIAIGLTHPAKTWIWAASLLWMGIACVANALRCGRRHCYYTGPFFLAMAVVSLLHGYQLVWLGPEGWRWLGATIGVGGGLLWCLPEHLWGKYRQLRTEHRP